MTVIPVDSTMLSAIGYDRQSNELEAVFADGAIWRYRNVPEHVYRELLGSESKGGYMRTFIIDLYPDYQLRRRS